MSNSQHHCSTITQKIHPLHDSDPEFVLLWWEEEYSVTSQRATLCLGSPLLSSLALSPAILDCEIIKAGSMFVAVN
jgi:hypothetical protein